MTLSPITHHPRLQLSEIAKAFGGIQAVRGVSLDVRRGEILARSIEPVLGEVVVGPGVPIDATEDRGA